MKKSFLYYIHGQMGPLQKGNAMERLRIVRRCGATPAERGSTTGQTCPDVLFLMNGSFYVIGLKGKLPKADLKRHGASIGANEAGVIVPGPVMRSAAQDIVFGKNATT